MTVTAPAMAQTDEEGEFLLKGLQQGYYDIGAQAPGFASGTRVATETGAGDVLITLAPGKNIPCTHSSK